MTIRKAALLVAISLASIVSSGASGPTPTTRAMSPAEDREVLGGYKDQGSCVVYGPCASALTTNIPCPTIEVHDAGTACDTMDHTVCSVVETAGPNDIRCENILPTGGGCVGDSSACLTKTVSFCISVNIGDAYVPYWECQCNPSTPFATGSRDKCTPYAD